MNNPLLASSALVPLAPWEDPAITAEALASIRQQTRPAKEVVVSCDGTPPYELQQTLLKANLPLRMVIGPGGEGVGPVLGRGLVACSHEAVFRCDADDISSPKRFELQMRTFEMRPELAVIGSQIEEFIQNYPESCRKRVGWRKVPESVEALKSFSRWRNPLNHPSVLLRRSRILAAGNYRSVSGFEDYDLWLRLLARGESLINLPEMLVIARVGPRHGARRHGIAYASKEGMFLLQCAREGLLNWPQVILLLLLRCPMRLLPRSALGAVTSSWFRS